MTIDNAQLIIKETTAKGMILIMNKDKLFKFYKAYKGEIIGTFIGTLFGLFVITVGFWKTVFVGLCAFVGYYIGKKISNNEIVELLDKILPPGKIQ